MAVKSTARKSVVPQFCPSSPRSREHYRVVPRPVAVAAVEGVTRGRHRATQAEGGPRPEAVEEEDRRHRLEEQDPGLDLRTERTEDAVDAAPHPLHLRANFHDRKRENSLCEGH